MNRQRLSGFLRPRWALVALVALLVASMAGTSFALTTPQIAGQLGNQAIEIDDLDNNPATTPNANMVSGTDAANPDYPAVAGATYIDWNDLALAAGGPPEGKYALFDKTGNADDGFAGTGTTSCLQPDHAAPQKEDLYRLYLANNTQYLYFGLVDKSPNGDSRHIILFHKNPLVVGAKCAGNGNLISVDLTPDDRIIRATFSPSATEPASQVYKLKAGVDPGLLLIDAASNFSDTTMWEVNASAVNFAVNTADVPLDKLAQTSPAQPNSSPVLAQTFGEGAVSLASLGVPSCGGNYQVSAITRSSGSGGGTAKDFLGGVYNFGSIAVTASLTPSCNLTFGYSAQATDAGGVNIPDGDVTYAWSCNNGALTFSGKSGTVDPAAAGAYNCTVTATQTSSSCQATSAEASTVVYAPIAVTIAPDATGQTCTIPPDPPGTPGSDNGNIGPVTFTASASGGDGAYTYSWTRNGPNEAGACGSNASCAVDIPDSNYCALSTIYVTVDDGSSLCPAVQSETEKVTKQTTVSVTNN